MLEKAQKQNMDIIAVTHNMHLAQSIAGRIYGCSRQEYLQYPNNKPLQANLVCRGSLL